MTKHYLRLSYNRPNQEFLIFTDGYQVFQFNQETNQTKVIQGPVINPKAPNEPQFIESLDFFGDKIVITTLKRQIFVNQQLLDINFTKKSSEIRFLNENTLLLLERDGTASLIRLQDDGTGTLIGTPDKPFFGRSVSLVCSYGKAIADKDGVVTYLKDFGERKITEIKTYPGYIRQIYEDYALTENGIFRDKETIIEQKSIVSFVLVGDKLYFAQQLNEKTDIKIKIHCKDLNNGYINEMCQLSIKIPQNFKLRSDITAVQLFTTKSKEVLILNQLDGSIHDILGAVKGGQDVKYYDVTAEMINMMCVVLVIYAQNPEKYVRGKKKDS